MIPYPEKSTDLKQASVQPIAERQILSLLQASVAHRITILFCGKLCYSIENSH